MQSLLASARNARNAKDLSHNFIERKHPVRKAGIRHRTGHTPNDTRCLILYQHPGPSSLEKLHPMQSILPHTSQYDSQHRAAI
jgi:hypothetical protein